MVGKEIRSQTEPLRQLGGRTVTESQFLGDREPGFVAQGRVKPRTGLDRICLHRFTQSLLSKFCKPTRANFW
jgi:hypothetical protein